MITDQERDEIAEATAEQIARYLEALAKFVGVDAIRFAAETVRGGQWKVHTRQGAD